MNGEMYVATIKGHAVYRMCDHTCITAINEEANDKDDVTIYPNPNAGTFTLGLVNTSAGKVEITITDMLGQNLYKETKSMGSGTHNLNISFKQKAGGVYFLHYKTDATLKTKMFVVK